MEASELRIGNWVQFRHTEIPVRITLGDFVREYNDEHLENYEPIPLTEQWLVKFGSDSVGCIKLPTGSTLQITMNKYGCVIWNGNLSECVEIGDCNHVHQLQNLYFALTGEELN